MMIDEDYIEIKVYFLFLFLFYFEAKIGANLASILEYFGTSPFYVVIEIKTKECQ